ncbi:hypothetical protein [Hyphomicrobium sp. MC8b]|uniref:hypothetical protein n=1 Tax=Hyphomicrobium sp. MC8b TaxID=300273 RepID=UPI00391C6289
MPCYTTRARASYTYEIADGVLALTDCNGPRSLTNDVENVLADLRDTLGLPLPATIVYRDTQGAWDGIAHVDGIFSGFYFLGTRDRDTAIAKAKSPTPERAI